MNRPPDSTFPSAVPGLLARYAHFAAAAGFIGVLSLLIVPIPPFLLDLFISVNFLMLFSTIYVSRAADLRAFPRCC